MLSEFVKVARFDELDDEDTLMVLAGGAEILLARVGDSVFAVGNACPHAHGGMLDMGLVTSETFEIECPLHGARFDLRSGEVTCAPAEESIPTYGVRIENGDILVGPKDPAG